MADVFPLILGIIILLASVISIKTGISVTVVEIAIGVIIGNLGFFHSESWMIYIASFGGILLTFLAGVEIDVDLMKDNFKESFTRFFIISNSFRNRVFSNLLHYRMGIKSCTINKYGIIRNKYCSCLFRFNSKRTI